MIRLFYGHAPYAIVHQTASEDMIEEQPILVTANDILTLEQRDATICVNKETLPELIRVMRDAVKRSEK